jgi:hypothetical protein
VPHTEEPEDPDLAAWREIVANYGDRPELPADDGGDPGGRPAAERGQRAESGPSYSVRFGQFDDEDEDDEPFEPDDDLQDARFVPPDPEPLHLGAARTAAWTGVLGAPILALLATVVVTATDLTVPRWFGWLLVAAFLGGFGYLVVTMPKDRDDPWDDGARL